VAAGILAVAIASTAGVARRQIVAENAPVPSTPVDDYEYAGIIRPRDVTTVTASITGAVQQVFVAVGDCVAAGQTLVELDDRDARRAITQLAFDAARVKDQTRQLERKVELLDQAVRTVTVELAEISAQLTIAQRTADAIPNHQEKDSVQRAQTAYDQAIAHERQTALVASVGGSERQDLEDAQIAVRRAAEELAIAKRAAAAEATLARLQLDQARAQAELAIAQENRTRADRTGELAQARVRQAQADRALDGASARLNDLTARAAAEGLVAEVGIRPGDHVLAGVPLIKLATIDPMVVSVDVPAAVVKALKRGDRAAVSLDRAQSEAYAGRILTVSAIAGSGGAHTITVEFPNRARLPLTGRTARVRVMVSR
jgi:membrane fusion protein (multidrug efflux system)